MSHWKTISNYDNENGNENTTINYKVASYDFLKDWSSITVNQISLTWFLPLKVFNLLTFSHPSPPGNLKRLTSLLFQHFKPVTTRIERCIKITVRPSSFYVTTRFITGFQVPVDTYCRKLYITRSLQPNMVERFSVAQNDRTITGFPPPLSDQDPDKNFSNWNTPTGQILQQWFLPFTKGRKNRLWQLFSQLQSDTEFGTALTLQSRKCQADLSTDPWNDFCVDFTNCLILTKDIYPHECI